MKTHKIILLSLSVLLLCAAFISKNEVNADAQEVDGRFTMGTFDNKSLLFGFPFSYSTSHFTISADGRYASNADIFNHSVRYLKGRLKQKSELASPQSEIKYTFAKMTISQKLVPVDKQFKEVAIGKKGNYYRIDYQIINYSSFEKKINFNLMLDVMVDKNDACQATADGKNIELDQKFYDAQVPQKMVFYKNKNNPQTDKFVLLTQTKNTPKPDAACMGQWVFLSNVLNFSQHESHPFTDDSAVMLNWKDKKIASGDTLHFSVYIGDPNSTVKIQHYEPKNKVKEEIYFETGQDELSEESKDKIQELVQSLGAKARPVLIEGYTDSSGGSEKNLKLSQGRIANVSMKMQMFGIKYKMILTKSHGEFYANEDAENGKHDRKVVITAWK